ncbi:alcohol dehydrogenase-like regulatory protein ErcA [Uliginosibacterium gangwonense]|uniref:alcohol dehydrogenase-like regulatory protein ErcA n=1 Tax=Uliginosibacterium gangwonense TaxID=392736 RepID=UPI00036B12C5|nr:alcohol dehydrogenase-like regulatory protein ErcA [Uliginosibacterium gangwonense]
MEIRKNVAPEFVLGAGALDLVGRYASNFAAKKVLVVSDPGVVAAGWAEMVIASLRGANIPSVLCVGVSPNPRDDEIMAGADMFLAEGCDVIVAVGGGSPMDAAKGIGIVATSGQSILSFEGVDQVWVPGPPLICIPTTAGTAADVSQFAIVNDSARKVKIAIISKAMVPDAALIDPRTTTTMDAELTAATGIDALVHAIEAYVSTASSPVTDLHALKAVQLIPANLAAAIQNPNDMNHRDPMMLGSLFAGLAFSNASLGLVHAMAHSLGGLLDLPHGMCNALLLEYVVAFNYMGAPERFAQLAAAFGVPPEVGADAQKAALIGALCNLRKAVGLGHGLRKMGVRQEDIPLLAQHAFHDPCVATNPVQPSVGDIELIYERALDEPR